MNQTTQSDGPLFKVSLTYSCGCREAWPVYTLPEDAETVIDVPCVPEHCQTCQGDGLCATRSAMLNYAPVNFDEIKPAVRRYRRLKAS